MPAVRTIQILDPREKAPDRRYAISPRVAALEGKRIGFNVGVWQNYHLFVDHLEKLLKARFPSIATSRIGSHYNTRRGPKLNELEDFCKNSDVIISGLAA
mgnify:CR=1 FL=1